MKLLSGVSIICICLILSSLTGIVTADSASYDKSVRISIHIDNGKITTTSSEIYYGSAPNLLSTQGDFTAELVAADGSTLKTFTVWDPRVQMGDVIVNDANGPRIQSVVENKDPVDSVVIFPFDRRITEFRLSDPYDGAVLTSVDLTPHIDSFFASYPQDPDNPATYGSKAPVTENPVPIGSAGPESTPSGQFLGILVIGCGAVLLLGGAFASVHFLRKRQKSVLIVDNDQDIIDVIAGMLKLGGYTTRAAASGAECLRELDSAIPDLILLDIGMEPMDGWETLKRIKKNKATRDIPVIMLTALRLTPKDVENYGIFIEDYVMKPVTSQGLKDTLMYVFAREQMIQEKIAAAKGADIDREELARLTRVVDVNKRLWDLLVKTYNLEEGMMQGAENEMTHSIKNIQGSFRDQEHQLEQIQRNLGSGSGG